MKLVWTKPNPNGGTLARVWLVKGQYHWDSNPMRGCCADIGTEVFSPSCKGLPTKEEAIKKAESEIGKWSYE
ncbi:MAG: hypothetical protein ACXABY_02830 [Candidatus Thorarchaeota archaeon]|jgi:hypothetical protein